MTLALRLAQLRHDKKESLQQVADAVGVSKAHVWQLERNRADNPSMAVLKGLADHFGVTVSFLIEEKAGAPKADPQLSRMFRQAGDLSKAERNILEDMMRSMIKRRRENAATK